MSAHAVPDFVREHTIDRVTLDIIEHALKNVRHEMDRVLVTTALSSVIREQADEFPLVADRNGRMVIGQFGSAIQTILDHSPYTVDDLHEGDIIATNDPYMMEGSTSHLPDLLLLRPIFYDGDLVGYASQWGNLIDVGGTSAGSIPIDARSIYEEGIRMPPLKLYERGRLNEEVLRMFCHNTRLPKVVEADIKAIAAGCGVAAQRVKELCDRFGKEVYLEACDAILDRTRSGLIQLIRKYVPEGERFEFEDYTDDDGLGNGPIKLKLTMWREGDTLNLDWTGTDPQVPGPVNFYLNPEMFKMFVGVFLIMAFDPSLTFNDGFYDLIKIDIPDGTVLRPRFPASLSNRLVIMARQFDVLQAVFAKAIKIFKVSGSYGTSPNLVYSGDDDGSGRPFQILEILYGGIPARPGGDGLDGHTWWPEFLSVPTEYLEKYYPIRVDDYRARADSGGAGKFRGGCGISKTYTLLADGLITFQDDRAHTYPYGVDGGRAGAPSRKYLVRNSGTRIQLPSKVRDLPVRSGDRLIFETAGAGGLGDPLERDPARVEQEVRRGLVSGAAARAEYGVVLGDDGHVDGAATEREREKLRAGRSGPLAEFDLGPIPPLDRLREEIQTTRREFNEWLSAGADGEPG